MLACHVVFRDAILSEHPVQPVGCPPPLSDHVMFGGELESLIRAFVDVVDVPSQPARQFLTSVHSLWRPAFPPCPHAPFLYMVPTPPPSTMRTPSLLPPWNPVLKPTPPRFFVVTNRGCARVRFLGIRGRRKVESGKIWAIGSWPLPESPHAPLSSSPSASGLTFITLSIPMKGMARPP